MGTVDARDRDSDSGHLTVIIVAVVLLAGAAGAFWIFRSHPAPKAAPHQPCQPLGRTAASQSSPPAPIAAGDWAMTVRAVHVERTLPNDKGVDSFALSSALVYLVVDTKLRNPHPGTEADLSSSKFELVCEDGTVNVATGLNQGKGFCVVCSFDIAVSNRSLNWSFAFQIKQGWTDQAFGLRYGTSETVMLPAPTVSP